MILQLQNVKEELPFCSAAGKSRVKGKTAWYVTFFFFAFFPHLFKNHFSVAEEPEFRVWWAHLQSIVSIY